MVYSRSGGGKRRYLEKDAEGFRGLGWMGYAADPLQERRSALTTGIIPGLVWTIWHFVPLIQMGRTLTWIAWWTLSTVALRILIVWLYNNTGKSVFAAIAFHATSNLSLPVFPMDYDHASVQFTLGTITAMAAVIVTFLWGPKTLARFRNACKWRICIWMHS